MSIVAEKIAPTRALTNDEKKAAEAAFRGAALNPNWSDAARKVYEGLSLAIVNRKAKGEGALQIQNN